ncbi:MAG: hypothetical protein LBH67_00055 [Rickettsia sp.]|jgi:hypothetical protein|nr:hypothetical protein [Rickettsia sp.]
MDKELINLFAEQNNRIVNHKGIDLLIRGYCLELLCSGVNSYIDDHATTYLLGTLEYPTGGGLLTNVN